MARKLILTFGVLLLIVGGVSWWRATHPPLTDQEQIAANLEGLRQSAESCSVEGVLGYASENFTWNGHKRSEIRSLLTGAFYEGFRKRDFRLTLTNVQVKVQGASATVTGHYKVDTRNFRSGMNFASGEFFTEWEKQDGQWRVTRASGGDNLSF